jgi:excisionase family DNA binding protein
VKKWGRGQKKWGRGQIITHFNLTGILTCDKLLLTLNTYQIMTIREDNRADSQTITTEQVAKILGVSKRTLKIWLHNGKVPEPKRDERNNYRIWTLADVDAVRRILETGEQ